MIKAHLPVSAMIAAVIAAGVGRALTRRERRVLDDWVALRTAAPGEGRRVFRLLRASRRRPRSRRPA